MKRRGTHRTLTGELNRFMNKTTLCKHIAYKYSKINIIIYHYKQVTCECYAISKSVYLVPTQEKKR